MEDIQSEFHKAFKSRGGVMDASSIPEPLRSHMHAHLNQAIGFVNHITKRNPKFPKVYVNYIANLTINAVARLENGYFLVGAHFGTFAILRKIFEVMFAHPDVLPKIGDISKEKTLPKLSDAEITHYTQFKHFAEKGIHYIPKDIERLKHVFHFTSLAMNFIIFHEYAHIRYGHLGLINQVGASNSSGIAMIEEIETEYSTGLSELDRQTIEMDADAGAIVWCYLYIAFTLKHPQQSKLSFFDSWETAIFNLSFSIYTFFKLFGHEAFNKKQLESTYPPPNLRQNMVHLTFIEKILKDHNMPDKDHVIRLATDTWAQAIAAAERAFEAISEQQLDVEKIVSTYSGLSFADYRYKIVSNWKKLRPNLEPHAFDRLVSVTEYTDPNTIKHLFKR